MPSKAPQVSRICLKAELQTPSSVGRDGEFRYAAKVEVYRSKREKRRMLEGFVPLASADCPFAKVPTKRPGDTWAAGPTEEDRQRVIWLRPELAVEVRFTERTRAGF